MKEIKCPKCGTTITVNDADFADILNQVRTEEFDSEVNRRIAEMKQVQQAEEAASPQRRRRATALRSA